MEEADTRVNTSAKTEAKRGSKLCNVESLLIVECNKKNRLKSTRLVEYTEH